MRHGRTFGGIHVPIKSYEDYRKTICDNFLVGFPEEVLFSRAFAEWLLDEHCKLLERYALYQLFKKEVYY